MSPAHPKVQNFIRSQKGRYEDADGVVVSRYLGLFTTELEAAQAYDRESVMRKGLDAVTNFDLSEYRDLLSPEDRELAKQRNLIPAAPTPHPQPGSPAPLTHPIDLIAHDISPPISSSSHPPLSPEAGPGTLLFPDTMQDPTALVARLLQLLLWIAVLQVRLS